MGNILPRGFEATAAGCILVLLPLDRVPDFSCFHCSEPAVLAEDEGPVLRERAVQDVAPGRGSWEAGTRAQTGLSACLAGFMVTAKEAPSSSAAVATKAIHQHSNLAQTSGTPASAEALPAQQIVREDAALVNAAEVRLKRQAFLDSLQRGSQPQGNGDSSNMGIDDSVSGQHPSHDIQKQDLAELKGKGIAVANYSGDKDQQPQSVEMGDRGAEAAGTANQSLSSMQQEVAEQSGSRQGEEQAHASGSAQQAHQECEICLTPMRFAYVSTPTI